MDGTPYHRKKKKKKIPQREGGYSIGREIYYQCNMRARSKIHSFANLAAARATCQPARPPRRPLTVARRRRRKRRVASISTPRGYSIPQAISQTRLSRKEVRSTDRDFHVRSGCPLLRASST